MYHRRPRIGLLGTSERPGWRPETRDMRVTVAGPTAIRNGRVALRGADERIINPYAQHTGRLGPARTRRGQQGREPGEGPAVRSAGGRQSTWRFVAFPECCITGYWFLRNLARAELLALAEPVPEGPSTRALLDLSRNHAMTIGAGLIEMDRRGRAAQQLRGGDARRRTGGGTGRSTRSRATTSSPGSEFTVFDTPHGCRVGVLICYDCNINENVRISALRGAEILLAPHQTGGCASKNPHQMGVIDRGSGKRATPTRRRSRRSSEGTRGGRG